jgi:hypothetical protein
VRRECEYADLVGVGEELGVRDWVCGGGEGG